MTNKNNLKGMLFNVQTFSIHDGPGIRTTVFMKGCNLSCYWCHNPESLSGCMELQFYKNKCIGCNQCIKVCKNKLDNQTARHTKDCIMCLECVDNCFMDAIVKTGYEINVDDLIDIIKKDKDIYTKSKGGVTFSGGEPLLQVDFLTQCLKSAKENDIHTAIESALSISYDKIEPLLKYIDLIICDIKTLNNQQHIQATGACNTLILENIRKLSKANMKLLIRIPIIPEFNDNLESMNEIADFILSLDNKHTVELLPFHGMCINKYTSLSLEYRAKDLKSPTKQKMSKLAQCFIDKNITIKDI